VLDVSLNELPRRGLEYLRTGNGVTLEILIGDNELVTLQICTQLGVNASRLVLGDKLTRMSHEALAHVAKQTAVFARVSPAFNVAVRRDMPCNGSPDGHGTSGSFRFTRVLGHSGCQGPLLFFV
jgi:hypothetical protein